MHKSVRRCEVLQRPPLERDESSSRRQLSGGHLAKAGGRLQRSGFSAPLRSFRKLSSIAAKWDAHNAAALGRRHV